MPQERKETYVIHMIKRCEEMICMAIMLKIHVLYMKMRRCEHDETRFEAVGL